MEDDFEIFIQEIENKLLQLLNTITYNIKNKQIIKRVINKLKISKIGNINKLLDYIKDIENINIYVIYLDLYNDLNIFYGKKTIIKELEFILIKLQKIIYIHITQNIEINILLKD